MKVQFTASALMTLIATCLAIVTAPAAPGATSLADLSGGDPRRRVALTWDSGENDSAATYILHLSTADPGPDSLSWWIGGGLDTAVPPSTIDGPITLQLNELGPTYYMGLMKRETDGTITTLSQILTLTTDATPFVTDVSPPTVVTDTEAPSTASLVIRGLGLAGVSRITLESSDGATAFEASAFQVSGDSLVSASVNCPAGASGQMTVVVATWHGEDRFAGWIEMSPLPGGEGNSPVPPEPGMESSLSVSRRQGVWQIAVSVPHSLQAPEGAIFNVQGRHLATIRLAHDTDIWKATWGGETDSGTRVTSGIYFLRIRAGRDILRARLLISG